MVNRIHLPGKAIYFMLILGALAFLPACGTKICHCLEEAGKENPDQEVMEKCREKFADMEIEEVQAAVEACGK